MIIVVGIRDATGNHLGVFIDEDEIVITKKEDLINTYIDHSSRELFSIWLELVKDVVEKDGVSIHWLKQNKYCSVESSVSGELFVNSIDGIWLKGKRELKLSDFKRTRTEYEKVTESIFDLRDEFERGELHFKYSQGIEVIKTEQMLLAQIERDGVYRKVEKVVDWTSDLMSFLRRELHDGGCVRNASIESLGDNLGCVNIDISFRHERFLELCRVALRANGEIG